MRQLYGTFHVDVHCAGNPLLAHRHPNQTIRCGHRQFVVGDHEELGSFCHRANQRRIALGIGVVQRR
ncbi:MAG TPA: hypothetical protein DIT50_04845, partial [Rhodocyclaceae bacterium]|nr:hypothetical protein [Rhodocyclaceae bacterium]